MAHIMFECPSCGKTMQAPIEKAGRRGKCRGCSASITVPGLLASAPAISSSTPENTTRSRSPHKEVSIPPPVQNMQCPGCNRKFDSDTIVVYCPSCGVGSHSSCYHKAGGCINPKCPEYVTISPKTADFDMALMQEKTRNFLDDLDASTQHFFNISSQVPNKFSEVEEETPQESRHTEASSPAASIVGAIIGGLIGGALGGP